MKHYTGEISRIDYLVSVTDATGESTHVFSTNSEEDVVEKIYEYRIKHCSPDLAKIFSYQILETTYFIKSEKGRNEGGKSCDESCPANQAESGTDNFSNEVVPSGKQHKSSGVFKRVVDSLKSRWAV